MNSPCQGASCTDGLLTTNNEEKDAEILRLTNLLEEFRQEAHELKSRLRIAERCASDYEAELEALQQDALEKDNLHAATIREIQEEKVNALKEAEGKIENWENDYQLLSDKVTGLQKELDAKSVNIEILNIDKNETAALHHELEEALEALTTSTAACNQHKELIAILQNDKQELAYRVESLEQNLELYKEYLSVSKTQLTAQIEESKEFQEQLAVTQCELTALKAAPDVQARGNSLFAEVEDNRQQMVKQYKLMLAKFNHMKNDYSAKCSEIHKLKKEKTILLDKLELTEREAKKHYKGFVENYEIRIKELQMAVNDLKNDVKPVYLNGNEEILKFAEHTVVNSRKEICSLREEMEMRSALRLNEAAELLKTRGELAEARNALRKSSLMVKELTTLIDERGNMDTLPSVRDLTSFEEESVKTKSPEAKSTAGRNSVVLQKSNQVIFSEELLHDMFNPSKKSKILNKKTVLEDVYPQYNKSEVGDTQSSKFEEWTNQIEVVVDSLHDKNGLNSDWTEGTSTSNAANLAVELGLQKKLDTDLDDVEVEGILRGENFEPSASEEASSTNKSMREFYSEKSFIRREEILNDVPVVNNPRLSTTLVISPTISGRFAPEMQETTNDLEPEITTIYCKSSPRLSDTKSCVTVRTPSLIRSNNMTVGSPIMAIDSIPKTDNLSLLNSTKSEETSRLILKVRPTCRFFENSVENVQKEVRFKSQEMESVEADKENFAEIMVKAEEDKDGVKIKEEENKPARRRPRAKQTQPIFYIS